MLEFDSWQRSETTRLILKQLLPIAGAKLLDVGGYPGRMRTLMPDHQWVLCDPLVDSPGEQVRGSAAALPFGDQTFDFAVSLDVLEHIPAENRPHVVLEMCRVSRTGILLSFPHNADWVIQAENTVREAYSKVNGSKEHPWLAEHALHPLPNVDEITDQFAQFNGKTLILDVGSIQRWMRYQLFDLWLERMEGGLELAKQLDSIYQNKIFPIDFVSPAYRKIIVHLFQVDRSFEIARLKIDQNTDSEMEWDYAFWRHFTDANFQENTQTQFNGDKQQDEYIRRLEKSLQLWEDTYAQSLRELVKSKAWRNRLEQRVSYKLFKRIMRILGKPIC